MLLLSWRKPIVLLNKHRSLAPSVSVGFHTIGAMLPYMPFHYLLFEKINIPAIVLTSGNISEEPIREVDLAIFTSKKNMQRKAHLNSNCYYVPHGCPTSERSSFLTDNPIKKPPDFPTRGDLFLGYWGTIDCGSVDINLLDWLSEKHADWADLLTRKRPF